MSCSDDDLPGEHPGRDDTPQSVEDPRVIQRLQHYRRQLEEGRRPDRGTLLAEFPEVAAELQDCLDALDFVTNVVPDFRSSDADGLQDAAARLDVAADTLIGDYRIIRQLGRGGMGVVYEAEQVSLARRVALKILPFIAVLDSRQVQRFQNEAHCAASLDHPNIVSVYSVGCERGLYYYAMKYVHGRPLAQVIKDLRHQPPEESNDDLRDACGSSPDTSLDQSTRTTAPSRLARRSHRPSSPPGTRFTPEFFRWAAGLGAEAAEGLEHAHQMGIVHRDIKPANLILDSDGHVRITDFGLALTSETADVTRSGELVGTLRYMSPEQLSGRRVLDHRTDIYSLGATLYELLTLQPAFDADSRQQLMRSIIDEEARPPSCVNRFIPRDLETVVLKAMAKEADDRYASAQDLADDLKRFCDNRPIIAGRPSIPDRLRKCLQRHSSAIWTAVAILLLLAVGSSVSAAVIWSKGQETARALLLVEARDRELSISLAGETAARKLAQRHEAQVSADKTRLLDQFRVIMRTSEKLRTLGESLWVSGQVESAEQLYRNLVLIWETVYRGAKGEIRDADALCLVAEYQQLSGVLEALGKYEEAEAVCRKEISVYEEQTAEMLAREEMEHVAPFYVSEAACAQVRLGSLLTGTGQPEEAEKAYRSAIAALDKYPDNEQSIYDPQWLRFCAQRGLGDVLWVADRQEDARKSYQQALTHWQKLAEIKDPAWDGREALAWLLATCPDEQLRDPQQAVKLAKEAVGRLPAKLYDCHEHERWCYWRTLGVASYRTGDWQAAADALVKSMELNPWGDRSDRFFLAMAQWQLGKQEEARQLYGEAVRWMVANRPKDPGLRRFREEAAKLIVPEPSKETPDSN